MQTVVLASCLAAASASYGIGYSAPGLGVWPSATNGYSQSTVWGAQGYRIGKRSADASYGYGLGVATLEDRNNLWGHQASSGYGISQGHPGYSGSTQSITKLHSGIIAPEIGVTTVGYGYGHGYGKRSASYGYGLGVATLEDRNNLWGHQASSGYGISQGHPGYSGSTQSITKLHSGIVAPEIGVTTVGYGYGHGYGKRSASYGYGLGVATLEDRNNLWGHQASSGYGISQGHPGYSGSTQSITKLHSGIVAPEIGVTTVGYGYGHGYGKRSYGVYGIATHENQNNLWGHQAASGYNIGQGHPGPAGSHQAVSRIFSGYGKRSADASYGYGIATHENQNNLWGHQAASGYNIGQGHPGAAGSHQTVSRIHSGVILPYSSGRGYLG